jgi:histidinol phosphatase-like PHP family hydrolase
MFLKGVFHIHSVFSDGEESLERLVEQLRLAGMSFAAVSDHAEVFDERRMEEYVLLCNALSTESFVIIPGLEFALHGGDIHILGYGITRRLRFKSAEALVDGIHEAGGLAVLAHPPFGTINILGPVRAKLDGIEVWNGRYDGTHAPRADSFQLLRRIRSMNPKAAAYCGIDLHKSAQLRKPVYVELETERPERETILTALRNGNFTLHGSNIAIPSTGNLTFVQELSIAVKQPLCRPWAG